ncbi:MAG TPA: bacterial transcriptional activator domain-containing protein [Rhodothermales bacterium]|nr:bacterial transcriptional activator domain-containing protein [Rhodothermales bacterium]
MFGKLCVRRKGKVLPGLESQKTQELLCYLLLHGDRPHAREVLASLLWDYCSTAQSRVYLRRVLWQLHQALDDRALPEEQQLLWSQTDWIQVNPQADLQLDVIHFESAYKQVRGRGGHLLDSEQAQALQQAIVLYAGPLLENFYQDWCLLKRERLQHIYLSMLDKLMDYAEVHGQYEMGLAYGEQILHIDRAREHTHRSIMKLYYLADNRTDALRQYEQCVDVLKEELDVAPSQRTTVLYKQICADRVPADPPAGTTSHVGLHDQLAHIMNLQQTLTSVQSDIQREIKAIEHVLNGSLKDAHR